MRGVATAALPPGLALKPIDANLRTALTAVVRDGPGDEWLKKRAAAWSCEVMPWDVADETHSAQYGLQRLATLPHGKEGAVHVRVLIGAPPPPNRPAGFWCVTDLSLSTVNQRNDDHYAANGSRLANHTPEPIQYADLAGIITVALSQADKVIKVLVEAHDEPRPRDAHFAAGLVGGLTSNVDIASLGRFTRDINQGADNVPLTKPDVSARLGELSASAAAYQYLDRLLLDLGFVTTP